MTCPTPDAPLPRLQRVRQILEQASLRPLAEQQAFVQQAAGPDAAIAEEVLAMLRTTVGGNAADRSAAAPADPPDVVQSTATNELLQKLAAAPKLDTHRYELQGEVGHGGMGVVLRIHDRHLNRRLAMKVLLERQAARDDEEQKLAHQVLGRFLEEAQVTSQLDHPGVVPVHELGLDHGGKVYFTMRLVKGVTAHETFAQARAGQDGWTTTRALEVVLKVCDTMSYAHDKRVLHRDLKPSNVMVGRFGEVYVMDWGLAKVLGQEDKHDLRIASEEPPVSTRLDTARKRDAARDEGSSAVSMDGQKLGTPSYMSPEQAKSEGLDERADVYSIGAMVYELLTGRAPYTTPGLRLAPYRILEKVVEGPPPRIETLDQTVSAELVAVVDRAMARDREQRYRNVTELAADLRAYLDQRVVQAYRTGALVEMQMWVRRNRPLAASLAAAVLILVAGIAGTGTFAFRAEQKSAEALEQKGKAEENAALAQRNEQLATDRAEENARLAHEKGALAAAEQKAKEEFAAKVREFDQLKGVVLYERAVANENELHPAWPSKVDAMETWLKDDAGKLLAMKDGLEQTVRDLEARALVPTAEELEADRRGHPKFVEFESLGKRVTSLRYGQTIREGKAQLVLSVLTAEQQALDATALNSLAWPRVAPPAKAGKAEERTIYGEEAFGLACARAAVAKVYGTESEYQVLDTLAWALLANGRDAEAKARSAEALGNAPDNEHDAYLGRQRDLEAAITKAAECLALAERELTELTTAVNERRTFRFELEAQRFLHDTLAELLGKLASLESKEKAQVEARLLWAKQVHALSLAHPKARHTWAAVRAAITRNDEYSGRNIELRDEDITGLVPIGENPETKLWEFYELRSAWDGKGDPREIAIPAHRADGSIEVKADTGIVFVLLPGGRFTMGAQRGDKDKPSFDPQAERDETPHEVTLLPFFLARHELTQGQWARLWSGDENQRWPSIYKVGGNYQGIPVTVGPSHPVENVSWEMCDTLLRRSGMLLPTEAQWEFGCRAGKTTPWYTGELPTSLAGHGNVRDRDAVKDYPVWGIAEALEDGFAGPAPVGHYPGFNAFGLYDVHGNVWEWCRDRYGRYAAPWQEGDGLRLAGSSSGVRCGRGGSYQNPAAYARSAFRSRFAPSLRYDCVGLRPLRTLRP